MEKDNGLKKFKSLVNKPWKVVLGILLSIVLLNQIISLTTGVNLLSNGFTWLLNTLGIYTQEVPSVTIKSDGWDSGTGGAWKIEKSAKWTSTSTAEVTFNVDTIMKTGDNYKDVILVLDISGSMAGEKLNKVKSDASELAEYLLANSNNRIALISFDSTSTILSEFTNDKELVLEKLKYLEETGCTNYNAGLKNVDVLMDDYVKENNRDVVTLFLTDGYPNEDIPNQVATYEILKTKHPYMTINGIQYEMGTEIVQEIKEISDNQFLADIESLNNVLFEASIAPDAYEYFKIVDYIHKDYFYITGIEAIEYSVGEIIITEENGVQKIIWEFGENSFLTGNDAEMKIKLKLKDQYVDVDRYYLTNSKEEILSKLDDSNDEITISSLTPILKSSYNVIYDTNPPSGCNIKSETKETHLIYENVTKKNTKLTCPGYIFKGWEIVDIDIEKINDDTFVMAPHDITIRAVWTKQLISKSMEGTIHQKATFYNLIRDEAKNGTYAKEYTGLDSDTYKNKVYYYTGDVRKNNVLFGGFCWKMVRTTDTGGVKMIYNGVPDLNGGCGNEKASSEITTLSFNSLENSLAYVGYMYNKVYDIKEHAYLFNSLYVLDKKSISNDYLFSDEFDYGTITSSRYTLINPYKLSDSDYSSLIGKYTLYLKTEDSSVYAYYVVGFDDSYMYSLRLEKGQLLSDADSIYAYGDDFMDNGDGTYSIINPSFLKKSEWYENYEKLLNKYICINVINNSCTDIKYNYDTRENYFSYYEPSFLTIFGNSYVYNDVTKKYTLVDTISSWDYIKDDGEGLNNYHYTCLNTEDTCDTLKYIIYKSYGSIYYVEFADGKTLDDIIYEMLWADDVNQNDSTIKEYIDTWFESNLLNYVDYIEDTVYCNDRRIAKYNSFNPNFGSVREGLRFYSYDTFDLTCDNLNDRFTMYSKNGNGKLKYPVGLLSSGEAYLALNGIKDYSNYLNSKNRYWLLSPTNVSYFSINNYLSVYGEIMRFSVDIVMGVRPVISLKPGTEYISGTGIADNPYVVFLGE